MRIPNARHLDHDWRIHEVTRDFTLEDLWALPTPGGPDDFDDLVRFFASGDTSDTPSRLSRLLYAIRWRTGELLGWDDEDEGPGRRTPSLRDRMPADLLAAERGPEFDRLPFTSLYRLEDEWAAEMGNRTVHAIMHIGWVRNGDGGYHGQMAVLTKPNGSLGRLYMAAILPFRRLIVLPGLMREIEQQWPRALGPEGPSEPADGQPS